MGIEAFGVSMQFDCARAFEEIRRVLVQEMGIVLSMKKSSNGMLGEYSDDRHIIDFQLSSELPTKRCTLAVRFSLCSYDTIDPIFIEIVTRFLKAMEAEVWLMTSALKERNYFLRGDSQLLIAALPDEIVEMRRYWQRLFGAKQGCIRVEDSFQFVGAMN